MTQETPAAADPATTAAPAPAAAAPAAPVDSLLPAAPAAADPAAKPAAAPAGEEKPEVKTDPNAPTAEQIAKAEADHAKWFYDDGTPGKGEMPKWFLADKFKNTAEQAKAYPELQKMMGAFTGPPKDGKYEFKMPDGLNVTLDESHPLLVDLQKWALENKMSQGGYQQMLGMLAQYEAAQIPDMSAIKNEVGENADARIAAVATWAQANLSPEEYQTMRVATSGREAGAMFKVLEAVVAKTRQVTLPKGNGDDTLVTPTGKAQLDAMMQKTDKDGNKLYFTDAKYRAQVDKVTQEYFSKPGQAA